MRVVILVRIGILQSITMKGLLNYGVSSNFLLEISAFIDTKVYREPHFFHSHRNNPRMQGCEHTALDYSRSYAKLKRRGPERPRACQWPKPSAALATLLSEGQTGMLVRGGRLSTSAP